LGDNGFTVFGYIRVSRDALVFSQQHHKITRATSWHGGAMFTVIWKLDMQATIAGSFVRQRSHRVPENSKLKPS